NHLPAAGSRYPSQAFHDQLPYSATADLLRILRSEWGEEPVVVRDLCGVFWISLSHGAGDERAAGAAAHRVSPAEGEVRAGRRDHQPRGTASRREQGCG